MIWSAEVSCSRPPHSDQFQVVVARLDCLESHDEAQISHYLRTALDTAEKVEERKESMLKELAEEILRGAASMTVPNRKLFRAFDIITSSGHYAVCVFFRIVWSFFNTQKNTHVFFRKHTEKSLGRSVEMP